MAMTRLSGLFAARPAANLAIGARYYATDTAQIYQNFSGVWVAKTNLDESDAGGFIAGANLGARPALPGNYLGYIWVDAATGNQYEAFPTSWALLGAIASSPSSNLNDAMIFKGVVDCSANPNYPAADRGDTYRVSVAGKIGGASGVNVEVADILTCLTDGTLAGTQAGVGASWTITQGNLDGAVIGPASVADGAPALFDGPTGKLLKAGAAAAGAGFLAYEAILNQSGSGAPVAIVKKNELSGPIVWTRIVPGSYVGTLAGAFTAAKTVIRLGTLATIGADLHDAFASRSSANALQIQTIESPSATGNFNPTDGLLVDTFIEIRVYP